jgi:hypothetical protein
VDRNVSGAAWAMVENDIGLSAFVSSGAGSLHSEGSHLCLAGVHLVEYRGRVGMHRCCDARDYAEAFLLH